MSICVSKRSLILSSSADLFSRRSTLADEELVRIHDVQVSRHFIPLPHRLLTCSLHRSCRVVLVFAGGKQWSGRGEGTEESEEGDEVVLQPLASAHTQK